VDTSTPYPSLASIPLLLSSSGGDRSLKYSFGLQRVSYLLISSDPEVIGSAKR